MNEPQQHCEHECVCHQAKSRPKNDCPIDFARAHGNKTCSCPHDTRPAPSRKTWESCIEHFTCPNGEECWYLSQDFHNDDKTTIRNQTLDETISEINFALAANWTPHREGLQKAKRAVESLRTRRTNDKI